MQEPASHNNEAECNKAVLDKPLRLLGMAKKAGLLAIGTDAVKAAARSGKAKLVVLASDTSAGSSRQARYCAEDSKTLCIDTPYTKFDFGNITGRGSPGTLAFLDEGLAEAFMKGLAQAQTGVANDKQRRRKRTI